MRGIHTKQILVTRIGTVPDRAWTPIEFSVTTWFMDYVKQVILIRKDLNMRRGKEIAQGSHASMEFLVNQFRGPKDATDDSANDAPTDAANGKIEIKLTPDEIRWFTFGVAKICLRVNSEAELSEYHEKALAAGLKSFIIRDSGRTEFHGEPTLTACAIGPASAAAIDAVTGNLVLY